MAKGRFYGNPTIQGTSPLDNTSPGLNKQLNPNELLQKVVDPKRKQTPMDLWSKASVANVFENTSVGDSKYDKGLNWNTDIDTDDIEGSINEYRANQQSGIVQLGAGLLRAGTKAAVEVAKLPGVVAGIAMSPFVEEGEGYDTAFNNTWIKGLDKINEEINSEYLPVYAKKAVTEGNLWDNITSTSFWATDGADGLGFMLGMMAPGAIINKLGMGAKLLSNSRKLAQYAGMAEKTEAAVTTLKGLGLTAKSIDVGAGAVVNTITEAGAEAKGVGDDLDRKKDQYISTNLSKNIEKINIGRIPEMIQGQMRLVKNTDGTQSMVSEGMIPNPEFENIKKQAMEMTEAGFQEQRALAMRDTFKSNLAVLIIPNLLMSKALFGKKADKLVSNIGKTTMQNVGARAAKVGQRYGAAIASEGFLEEGSQTAIETMFTDKAMANKLSRGDEFDGGFISGGLQDFSVGEAADAYSDMVNSTEGQKAIFLGAAMGAPMMSYQGRKEDVYNQDKSNKILSNIDSSIHSFNTIFDNDIYRRDPNDETKFIYKKDEDGNDTSERQIDRVKALEVAKSLNYNEQQSKRLDWAIQNGRTDIVDELRDRAIFDLIQPSIYYGEAGIQALTDKLNNSSQFQEILKRDADPQNKNKNKDFVKKALDTASYLQKQNEKFVDFAGDIIDLQDPRATKEDKQNYINHLNTQYLQAKYNQYNAEGKLKTAIEKRNSILEELNIQMPVDNILENNRQVNEARQTNKILDDNLNEISALQESIDKNKKDINELWSGKDKIDKSFSNYIDRTTAANESQSDEKVAKAENTIAKIKRAKNKKELKDALEEDKEELSDKKATKILNKEVQSKVIDEVTESVGNDESIDNLRSNIEKLKNLSFSSKKINELISKIETSLNDKIQQNEEFKAFLEETMAISNQRNEEILLKLIDVEDRLSKLAKDKELLTKSLNQQDKAPKGRNAKLLKQLIEDSKQELARIEKEIEDLDKQRIELVNQSEVIDNEVNTIILRYNQVEKLDFTSIKDIIDYLEDGKKYFTNQHRQDLGKLLVNRFLTEKSIGETEATISELENYVDVLKATINNLLELNQGTTPDASFIRKELLSSTKELFESKQSLRELTDKLKRLNDAILTKEGLESLNKEIEFWKELQEFRKDHVNELYDNPVIQQIIAEKEQQLTDKELKDKKKEEKRQRKLEETSILDDDSKEENIEPGTIVNEDGTFESESIPDGIDEDKEDEVSVNEEKESKDIEKESNSINVGTKVISTNKNTGKALYPNIQQFVDYEQEPRDKSKDTFTFEIGDPQFTDKEILNIIDKVKKGKKLSKEEIKSLEDKLPIKTIVKYTTKDENGDDVNRTAFSFIENKSKAISEDEDSLEIYKKQNAPLRKSLVKYLIENKSFEGLTTNVYKQFPGVLKVDSLDENSLVKKNNIFDLDVFKNMSEDEKIEYFQRNTAYVNQNGELLSTLGNKKPIRVMSPDNRGKVFLRIPMNNGRDFWLKLNINKITDEKSEAVYEMIKAISAVSESVGAKKLNAISIDQFFNSLDESDPILSNRLQTTLEDEIKLVESFDKGKVANRNLARLLDLVVYHKSNNKKTAFNLQENGDLILGSLAAHLIDGSGFKDRLSINKDELQSNIAKDIIIDYLKAKRYNVLITKDSPGQFVFNNKEYVKYLLGTESGNSMLSTNAVVNEPTFGGYSNIYLNQNLEGLDGKKKATSIKAEEITQPMAPPEVVAQQEVEFEKANIEKRRQSDLNDKEFLKYPGKEFTTFSEDDYRKMRINDINNKYDAELAALSVKKENIKESKKEVISDVTYKVFKENKYVSDRILDEISRKIYDNKPLSDRENEMYQSNKKYVDEGVVELGNSVVEIVNTEDGRNAATVRRFASAITKDNSSDIIKAWEKADEDTKVDILMILSDSLEEIIDVNKSYDAIFKEFMKIAKNKKISAKDHEKICSL